MAIGPLRWGMLLKIGGEQREPRRLDLQFSGRKMFSVSKQSCL